MQNSSTTFKWQVLLWVVCRTQFVMAFQQRRVKMQGKYYKKVVSMSLFEWSELSQMDDYLSHKNAVHPYVFTVHCRSSISICKQLSF